MICGKCKSGNIRKHGFRYNKLGKKQRFQCIDCKYLFVVDDGFKKVKHKKEVIVRAIHQYNDGLSLSKIQNHLYQHDGVAISRVGILNWVNKYSGIIKKNSFHL